MTQPTIEQSIKLAKLWTNLSECKDKLDSEIVPVAGYLEVEDTRLVSALEGLSEAIGDHLTNHRLIAVVNKK